MAHFRGKPRRAAFAPCGSDGKQRKRFPHGCGPLGREGGSFESFSFLNHLFALLRVEDDSLETGVLVGPQQWGCRVFPPLLGGNFSSPTGALERDTVFAKKYANPSSYILSFVRFRMFFSLLVGTEQLPLAIITSLFFFFHFTSPNYFLIHHFFQNCRNVININIRFIYIHSFPT